MITNDWFVEPREIKLLSPVHVHGEYKLSKFRSALAENKAYRIRRNARKLLSKITITKDIDGKFYGHCSISEYQSVKAIINNDNSVYLIALREFEELTTTIGDWSVL